MSAQLAPEIALREATAPPEHRGVARDAVRMLVTDRETGEQHHAHFYDLATFIKPGDLLVANDSATLPAALRARRENGELLLVHVSTMIDEHLWVVEPRGEVASGERLALEADAQVTFIAPVAKNAPRLWYAQFALPLPMHAFLNKVGAPIRYGYMHQTFPLSDYQTLFARKPGSAEMPSAARPFTERIVRDVRRAAARMTYITLHCGVASFEAPEIPGIERFTVSPETADSVNATRANGGRVIAIGTTVVRALESAVSKNHVIAASGWTDPVIEPTFERKATGGLITGFHAPTATHVAMLRSFLSEDLLTEAYDAAAHAGYYCHEFGDSHLIV